MNINLNNYEAYFLDYYEGSLSPALVEELKEFILTYPELREEFEIFELVTLDGKEEIGYEGKQSLKKQNPVINSTNFDEYAVEYIEGTLPTGLQQDFETFINHNPIYRRELDLYVKTKLTPDVSTVFEDKYALKRRIRQPVAMYYWSAAASVAVIMGMWVILNKNEVPKENGIVKHIQSKDIPIVAHHNTKPVITDSTPSRKKFNRPFLNNNQPQIVAVKTPVKNQDQENRLTEAKHDSISNKKISENRVDNTQLLPIMEINGIPNDNENTSFVFGGNLRDTTSIINWKMKYNSRTISSPVVASAEAHEERTRSKILYLIGKVTCKGLHKITGQRIQLEKKYNSDTTNVIAYQLDLGKARIQFPVKE